MNTRVIAFARTVGAAGEDVAQATAKQLGFRFYDYQIVQEAAQEAGVSSETVSDAEHTPSLMTRILEALARNPSMPVAAWADPVPLATSPLLTSSEYRRFIEEVVRDLARQGDAVIVGHGSTMILHDRTDVLRVCVTGSRDVRATRMVERMGIDQRTAERTIERSDHERMDYFRRFYEREWLAPDRYDLCINTDRVTIDQATSLIVAAAQLR